MIQYYVTIIAYTQQLLDMGDLFGTSANCREGISTFIEKKLTQVVVGYRFLNVA